MGIDPFGPRSRSILIVWRKGERKKYIFSTGWGDRGKINNTAAIKYVVKKKSCDTRHYCMMRNDLNPDKKKAKYGKHSVNIYTASINMVLSSIWHCKPRPISLGQFLLYLILSYSSYRPWVCIRAMHARSSSLIDPRKNKPYKIPWIGFLLWPVVFNLSF